MNRIISLDLDGTLHDNTWSLSRSLAKKLFELQDEGYLVGINTGRELLGSLFFINSARFPFDFLCPGHSSFIPHPLSVERIMDLYNPGNISIIKDHSMQGLGKVQSLQLVQEITETLPENILHIDNGPIESDRISFSESKYLLSSCGNDNEWNTIVLDKRGLVSSKSGPLGTLEILNSLDRVWGK